MAFQGFAKIAENLTVFVKVPLLVTWLNSLNKIEADFARYFGNLSGVSTELEITKLRNLLLGSYLCVPGLLWTTLQYSFFYQLFAFNPNYWLLGQFWFFSVQYMLLWQQHLEAIKMVLMLATVKRMYATLRGAIGMEVEKRCGRIGMENIEFWRSFAASLRRQAELTGKYLQEQLLLSIAELVMTTSAGLHLTLYTLQNETFSENAGFVACSLLFCASHAFQLYLKVIHAEGIYTEVPQFVWLLCHSLRLTLSKTSMFSRKTSCMKIWTTLNWSWEEAVAGKLFRRYWEQGKQQHATRENLIRWWFFGQVRCLQHKLREKPALIGLGNYAVLNKGLLVQVNWITTVAV